MARILRQARPDKLDPEALARMAAVVARQDAAKARAAMWSRVGKLAAAAAAIAFTVALFYAATN